VLNFHIPPIAQRPRTLHSLSALEEIRTGVQLAGNIWGRQVFYILDLGKAGSSMSSRTLIVNQLIFSCMVVSE
jgi:hypothetical protein